VTYFKGHPVDSFGGDQMTRHFLKIMLPFTLVFFVLSGVGGFLVFDSVWNSGSVPNSGSLVEVIGGAVLLALGLFAVYPQVRLALCWMQAARDEYDRNVECENLRR
jgi:hypothetical protein